MSTTSWVAREMNDPDFGDARLNKRLVTLLEQLAAQPTASLPQACGVWKDTKAAYRFLASDKVTPQAIRDAHFERVYRRMLTPQTVLALTDTTDLDLSSQPQMQGLGPLGATEQQGLKVHSVLLASEVGVPLGLVHQQVWARDPATKGQGKDCRKRDLGDKESSKWLTALEKTEWAVPANKHVVPANKHVVPANKHVVPANKHVVLVGDREADMFPLFAAPRRSHTDFLVRCAYDRRIEAQAPTLRAALATAPVVGTRTLGLRSREAKPAREAVLSVRFTSVTLVPPAYDKGV